MRALIIFFIAIVCALPAVMKAQTPAAWVELAPHNESFRVRMPERPRREEQRSSYGEFNVSGEKYTGITVDAAYTVWSLSNQQYGATQSQDPQAYLDACADLIWEFLLKPLRDKLPQQPRVVAAMTFRSQTLRPTLQGREYQIRLGDEVGETRFYVAAARIYVLVALSRSSRAPEADDFFKSFSVGSIRPADVPNEGDNRIPYGAGVGPGNGGGGDRVGIGTGVRDDSNDTTDYNRTFSGRETTVKARILSKPEPQYTENARKYGVTGTIVARAIFSKDGQVTEVRIIKGLPHGLTQMAIVALRQIKFTPAEKNGHLVSQYMQIEYNFNLY
jgi:TonB family protein